LFKRRKKYNAHLYFSAWKQESSSEPSIAPWTAPNLLEAISTTASPKIVTHHVHHGRAADSPDLQTPTLLFPQKGDYPKNISSQTYAISFGSKIFSKISAFRRGNSDFVANLNRHITT